MMQNFKVLVSGVGRKATVTKRAICIRDDHETMKTKLKLRKQAHKDVVHDNSVMVMETLKMSSANTTYYGEWKAAIRLKGLGYLLSIE